MIKVNPHKLIKIIKPHNIIFQDDLDIIKRFPIAKRDTFLSWMMVTKKENDWFRLMVAYFCYYEIEDIDLNWPKCYDLIMQHSESPIRDVYKLNREGFLSFKNNDSYPVRKTLMQQKCGINKIPIDAVGIMNEIILTPKLAMLKPLTETESYLVWHVINVTVGNFNIRDESSYEYELLHDSKPIALSVNNKSFLARILILFNMLTSGYYKKDIVKKYSEIYPNASSTYFKNKLDSCVLGIVSYV